MCKLLRVASAEMQRQTVLIATRDSDARQSPVIETRISITLASGHLLHLPALRVCPAQGVHAAVSSKELRTRRQKRATELRRVHGAACHRVIVPVEEQARELGTYRLRRGERRYDVLGHKLGPAELLHSHPQQKAARVPALVDVLEKLGVQQPGAKDCPKIRYLSW
eukprot:3674573-Pleurochrysis_carterae.AAC.1